MLEAGQTLDEELFKTAKDIVFERAAASKGEKMFDFCGALEIAKDQYRHDILKRFRNPSVADTVERLLMDSSEGKLIFNRMSLT
jgi:mannitol-1-phosphate/altronate dehydrogenase